MECICDGTKIQTERHVLVECPLSEHLRGKYPMLQFTNIKQPDQTVATGVSAAHRKQPRGLPTCLFSLTLMIN
ncbi:hypothetical protein E2C01_048125 [Portunus trituberculatus]|uniref:Uncharacterized protein n=1 Tax=Portunus trituberculatus TaxID=210409 RepID=A0A5B7G9S5_PORTR|nr:hypothetical protein [Portunus trituberculatus]